MTVAEVRDARSGLTAAGPAIAAGPFAFLPAAPTWAHPSGAFREYGPYLDWSGCATEVVRDASPPYACPVIIEGPNGCGKDALALEVARRLGLPYFLTVIGPQTTNLSLVMTPVLPLESRTYALTPHTTAQLCGGCSVISEAGKNLGGELPFTAQGPAYDGHAHLTVDSPPVAFQVHPDHALLLLVLPGESIQADLLSRSAYYRLEAPPPEVLLQIARANMADCSDLLLDALRDLVCERVAAGQTVTPRAAHLLLARAHKAMRADSANTRLSARAARRLLDAAALRVACCTDAAAASAGGTVL